MWGSPVQIAALPEDQRSIPTCVGQPFWRKEDSRPNSVYPHVCGAAVQLCQREEDDIGLSPRVWGSLNTGNHLVIGIRSIPTCVGQPRTKVRLSLCRKVYPHVCGAATPAGLYRISAIGLSPRVWGSHTEDGASGDTLRSIPTCVGQPRTRVSQLSAHGVYPHVCGAALTAVAVEKGHNGLSPRVWGSPASMPEKGSMYRSIPTCVGQPSQHAREGFNVQVYPHVCGAALRSSDGTGPPSGLSPRVWGSPALLSVSASSTGSIPTCVGQPHIRMYSSDQRQVYPHVCGAAYLWRPADWELVGLSPRVWGSRVSSAGGYNLQRSIPTCVGQPDVCDASGHARGVYPHVCGAAGTPSVYPHQLRGLSPRVWGSPLSSRYTDPGMGLSPRVWGSHILLMVIIFFSWSIPTCVGQPTSERYLVREKGVYPHVCGAATSTVNR